MLKYFVSILLCVAGVIGFFFVTVWTALELSGAFSSNDAMSSGKLITFVLVGYGLSALLVYAGRMGVKDYRATKGKEAK